jgi:hypothetical protein
MEKNCLAGVFYFGYIDYYWRLCPAEYGSFGR